MRPATAASSWPLTPRALMHSASVWRALGTITCGQCFRVRLANLRGALGSEKCLKNPILGQPSHTRTPPNHIAPRQTVTERAIMPLGMSNPQKLMVIRKPRISIPLKRTEKARRTRSK
jgi:hypothetical protein